jgi:hypothetical protein
VGLFIAYARSKGNTTYTGENVESRPAGLTREGTVNDLLIPLASSLSRKTGKLGNMVGTAQYRASTVTGATANNLYFSLTELYSQSWNNRTNAYPVRCFKNTVPKPLVGDISYSTTTLTNQDVVATLTLNRAGTVLES